MSSSPSPRTVRFDMNIDFDMAIEDTTIVNIAPSEDMEMDTEPGPENRLIGQIEVDIFHTILSRNLVNREEAVHLCTSKDLMRTLMAHREDETDKSTASQLQQRDPLYHLPQAQLSQATVDLLSLPEHSSSKNSRTPSTPRDSDPNTYNGTSDATLAAFDDENLAIDLLGDPFLGFDFRDTMGLDLRQLAFVHYHAADITDKQLNHAKRRTADGLADHRAFKAVAPFGLSLSVMFPELALVGSRKLKRKRDDD